MSAKNVPSFVFAIVLTLTAQAANAATPFTGGDPGEGLNFSGTYLAAVDVNGPGGTVQGLTFSNALPTGFTLINGLSPGFNLSYGPSLNDAGLKAIMDGLQFAPAPQSLVLQYPVTTGKAYELQLLVSSAGANQRSMDVTVDGATVEDNLFLPGSDTLPTAPSPGSGNSYLVKYAYTASSPSTVVNLGPTSLVGGNAVGGDNNAVLSAFTLKELGTVGYWQLQDGAPATNVTTTASTVNNGSLQGTTTAGTPTFSASVPGTLYGGSVLSVVDGLGGPVVNSNNTASMSVVSGDTIQIPQSSLTEASSMTIEFFYKTTQSGAYAGVVVLPSAATGAPTNDAWGLGTWNANGPFSRVDVVGGVNSTMATGPAINDNQWHHLALTFDGNTKTQRLYLDYNQVAGYALPNGLAYDGLNGLRFGTSGTAFQPTVGLIDEIRYSNFARTPSQFLRAVPEPSSLALMAFAALGLGLVRRKFNAGG